MGARRSYTRVSLPGNVELTTDRGTWQARLVDISLLGACVVTTVEPGLTSGDPCTMHLHPDGGTTTSLRIACVAAHIAGNRVGLTFSTVDVATLTALRTLLEQTTGDRESIDTELSRWLHQ